MATKQQMAKRLNQERYMIARGYHWKEIIDVLKLTPKQAQGDRKRLKQNLLQDVDGNPYVAFELFRDSMQILLGKCIQIIESDDPDIDVHAKIRAIKEAAEINKAIHKAGVQCGVLLTAHMQQEQEGIPDNGKQKLSLETTRTLQVEGSDLEMDVIRRIRESIPISPSFD